MLAKKLAKQKTTLLCFAEALFILLLACCGKHTDEDLEKLSSSSYLNSSSSNYGRVTFFNESSYAISVNESFFEGTLLIDKLASGRDLSITVNPSNNYGNGTVFSIRYWYLVADDFDLSSGEVWTSGIDPNMQIKQNIEAGVNYVIQVPNPSNLEFKEAFVKIINASNKPFELNHLSMFYKQAGNGEISVPSGKIGFYKIDASKGGTKISDYTITQIFEQYPFPEFTAKNGYIYNFIFDGNSVILGQPPEQSLIF